MQTCFETSFPADFFAGLWKYVEITSNIQQAICSLHQMPPVQRSWNSVLFRRGATRAARATSKPLWNLTGVILPSLPTTPIPSPTCGQANCHRSCFWESVGILSTLPKFSFMSWQRSPPFWCSGKASVPWFQPRLQKSSLDQTKTCRQLLRSTGLSLSICTETSWLLRSRAHALWTISIGESKESGVLSLEIGESVKFQHFPPMVWPQTTQHAKVLCTQCLKFQECRTNGSS